MPNDAQIALQKKLQLEAQLRPKLEAFNRRTVREFTRVLGLSGAVPENELERVDELAALLLAHYKKTGRAFDDELRDDMPEDLAMTSEESADVAAVLAAFFAARAPAQSLAINETTTDQFRESEQIALAEQQRQAEEGVPMGQLAVAAAAGATLARKLAGRVTGIVTLETQAPAEAAKWTEASVLSGEDPEAAVAAPSAVKKDWISVGDERVRDGHVDADTAPAIPLNQPFSVMGELLRFPGDTSLGATMPNVANCRCSSDTSVDSVVSARQDMPGFAEAPAKF